MARWAEGIDQVRCIGGRFRRPEPRRRVQDYLRGLLSPVERERLATGGAADATPDGVAVHLPVDDIWPTLGQFWWWTRPDSSRRGTSPWVCSVSTAGRRGGSRTVRAYSWPMPAPRGGRCWTGSCTCPKYGHAAGRPGCRGKTKPQLAREMLERALESGVPFGWVAGMRSTYFGWRERGAPRAGHKRSEKLWAGTKKGPRQVRADRLASQVLDWSRCSSGDGAKGPRVYDWAKVEIRPLKARQGLFAAGPPQFGQPWRTGLRTSVMARNSPGGTGQGRRDPVGHQECFEEAKGQVRFYQYEVRTTPPVSLRKLHRPRSLATAHASPPSAAAPGERRLGPE